jgi:hypothetical protein
MFRTMGLILLFLIVAAATLLVQLWAALTIREHRWRLYELRDQLRWHAIEDKEFAQSAGFEETDRALSTLCHNVDSVSIFALGQAVQSGNLERDTADLRRHEIHVQAVKEMLRILAWRHHGLVLVAGITFLGIFPLVWFWKKARDKASASLLVRAVAHA